MKQQRINRNNLVKKPQIIDERTPQAAQILTKTENESRSNAPVRVVMYVEVRDMSQLQVRGLMAQINAQTSRTNDTQYVVPIRHGKITTDMYFEQEFLDVVNKMCEVKDGTIVLKNGAQDLTVVREVIE